MKIEHLAIWVIDLETTRSFYETFFGASSNEKYTNASKGFSSYFLSFASGARLELMHQAAICQEKSNTGLQPGLAHFAVSVGSVDRVDQLTAEIQAAGYTILGNPRTTGDGYYESVVADPEGNRIEITV